MECVTVDCPNEECDCMPDYQYESENSGPGCAHEMTCPECNTRIKFYIEYFPSAMGEEVIE